MLLIAPHDDCHLPTLGVRAKAGVPVDVPDGAVESLLAQGWVAPSDKPRRSKARKVSGPAGEPSASAESTTPKKES